MYRLYNVNVKRQIPYLVIEQVKAIVNTFKIKSELTELLDEKDNFFFFKFVSEGDVSIWSRGESGFLEAKNKKVSDHSFLDRDYTFFALPKHYGSTYYGQENLDEIMAKGITSFPVLEFENLSVKLELANLRDSPIESNWGTTVDIVLRFYSNQKLLFETTVGTDYIEIDNIVWQNDVIDYFERDEENKDDMIVVDYKAFYKNGDFFEDKAVFNIKEREIIVDHSFKGPLVSEFCIFKGKSFKIQRGKDRLIKKEICEEVGIWKQLGLKIKDFREKFDDCVCDSDSLVPIFKDEVLKINDFEINPSVIKNKGYKVIEITKENPIHKILEDEIGIRDYDHFIFSVKRLHENSGNILLYSNERKGYLEDYEFYIALSEILSESYEHSLEKFKNELLKK